MKIRLKWVFFPFNLINKIRVLGVWHRTIPLSFEEGSESEHFFVFIRETWDNPLLNPSFEVILAKDGSILLSTFKDKLEIEKDTSEYVVPCPATRMTSSDEVKLQFNGRRYDKPVSYDPRYEWTTLFHWILSLSVFWELKNSNRKGHKEWKFLSIQIWDAAIFFFF